MNHVSRYFAGCLDNALGPEDVIGHRIRASRWCDDFLIDWTDLRPPIK